MSLTTTDLLHTLYLPTTPRTSLTMMPTAPTTEYWMATRSHNATAHPGAVDISMEEEMADNIPKTPAPKKHKARNKKNIKSAEEIEVGIQHVAAYKRQSLKEELVHVTPQVVYTPAPPHDPSEPHESSEHDEGGNISDNESYQPPIESVGDVSMSEAEISSPLSPVRKTVGQGMKEMKRGDKKGKKAVICTKEESGTESDDEPTPFKKVVSKKGKRFEKNISGNTVEETPIKAMKKGKGKVPIAADDSVTEDKLVIPQKTGNARAASAAAKQVSKAPAVAGLASSSGNKSVQPVPAPT